MKRVLPIDRPRIKRKCEEDGTDCELSYDLRPEVRGKFIFIGEQKFWMKGVTYGTFAPQQDGAQFPAKETVERDFQLMRENSVNCVRTYTVPPVWLLDCARDHGMRVMVGMPWEQHITFLDDPKRVKDIKKRMKEEVKALNRHPAILLYSIGNEIPPAMVRWYGRVKIEKFLKELYRIVKEEDPEGLVTYVNFPTTEYLKLNFLDVMCFNVYLEQKEVLENYLYRLHNLSDDKPLIMAEIGLDSRRNGEEEQCRSLDWQLKSVFATGCAGAFIFAWTDEWYRGGMSIDDWDFGLTTRDRTPKQALSVIKNNFDNLPFPEHYDWPRISVFVCSFNGASTLRQTLTELNKLKYDNYEVVVVDDGSRDATAKIAREFKARLISTENRGLSVARNEAMADEAGEIVVYCDDDAYPDCDWLNYIAYTFLTTDFMAVGGPNFLPLESGLIENCVGNAPGQATHVLINDREAEHIPGCNMAYRKTALKVVGGFDAQFRAAGDDVDVCWKIIEMGWKVGYHPAALVWHYRRDTIKTYYKQQFGYGKAEAMLEDKWPEKYNAIGHIPWSGRIYGTGLTLPLATPRWRVYQGMWGTALFQSLYEQAPNAFFSLPLMPEWYLVNLLFALLSGLGIFWKPLLAFVPLLVICILAPIIQSFVSARKAKFTVKNPSLWVKIKLYCITAYLHMLQPLARLIGRVQYGLVPLKVRGNAKIIFPRPKVYSLWREEWLSHEDYLNRVEEILDRMKIKYFLGGDYDSWDIEVRGGLLGSTRCLLTIEEHGQGKQLLRFRLTPNHKYRRTWIILFFFVLSILAALDGAMVATVVLCAMSVWLFLRMLKKCAYSESIFLAALKELEGHEI